MAYNLDTTFLDDLESSIEEIPVEDLEIDPKLLNRASQLARRRGLTIEQWMEQNVRGAVESSGR